MKSDTFRCPKCGFEQHYAVIDASTGNVLKNTKEDAHQPCPNDGETLLPVFDESELQ